MTGFTSSGWKPDGLDRVVAPYACINGLSALFEIAKVSIPDDSEREYTDDAFNPDVAAANLLLISAAPDLYAAVDALLDAGEFRKGDESVKSARAALAKARGEA